MYVKTACTAQEYTDIHEERSSVRSTRVVNIAKLKAAVCRPVFTISQRSQQVNYFRFRKHYKG